jgi:hypothetical protein
MTTLNLSNVRLILDAYGRVSAHTFFGGPVFEYSKNGFSALYSITEERYKIEENYKIGVVGNFLQGVSNQDFYQSDLETLIKDAENQHAGFYQLCYSTEICVGDLIPVTLVNETTGDTFSEIPHQIVGIQNGHAFVKPVIEIFHKPARKSIWDFITQNQYWDCQTIDLAEITQKFEKLDPKVVMPGYKHYKDEDVA